MREERHNDFKRILIEEMDQFHYQEPGNCKLSMKYVTISEIL